MPVSYSAETSRLPGESKEKHGERYHTYDSYRWSDSSNNWRSKSTLLKISIQRVMGLKDYMSKVRRYMSNAWTVWFITLQRLHRKSAPVINNYEKKCAVRLVRPNVCWSLYKRNVATTIEVKDCVSIVRYKCSKRFRSALQWDCKKVTIKTTISDT